MFGFSRYLGMSSHIFTSVTSLFWTWMCLVWHSRWHLCCWRGLVLCCLYVRSGQTRSTCNFIKRFRFRKGCEYLPISILPIQFRVCSCTLQSMISVLVSALLSSLFSMSWNCLWNVATFDTFKWSCCTSMTIRVSKIQIFPCYCDNKGEPGVFIKQRGLSSFLMTDSLSDTLYLWRSTVLTLTTWTQNFHSYSAVIGRFTGTELSVTPGKSGTCSHSASPDWISLQSAGKFERFWNSKCHVNPILAVMLPGG